jgi:hypothetical protein
MQHLSMTFSGAKRTNFVIWLVGARISKRTRQTLHITRMFETPKSGETFQVELETFLLWDSMNQDMSLFKDILDRQGIHLEVLIISHYKNTRTIRIKFWVAGGW